jgi:hypothetical protein
MKVALLSEAEQPCLRDKSGPLVEARTSAVNARSATTMAPEANTTPVAESAPFAKATPSAEPAEPMATAPPAVEAIPVAKPASVPKPGPVAKTATAVKPAPMRKSTSADREISAEWHARLEEVRALVAALPAKISLEDTSAPTTSENGELSAASSHARAEELHAMATTLPSKKTRPLMAKIAAIYDKFASEAEVSGPSNVPGGDLGRKEDAQAAAPPADLQGAERVAFPADDCGKDEGAAVASPDHPRSAERVAFPRRAVPSRSNRRP